MRIRALCRNHGQRILQREVQDGFRGQLDLLALRSSLHTTAETASGSSTDAGSLAATRNPADDGSDGCARAHLLSRVFAAGTALTFVLVGLYRVRLAIHRDAVELQHQQ